MVTQPDVSLVNKKREEEKEGSRFDFRQHLIYSTKIRHLVGIDLEGFFLTVLSEKTYIKDHYVYGVSDWCVVVPQICGLIRRIIKDVFKVDMNYEFFQYWRDPKNGKRGQTIEGLVQFIENKLSTTFRDSPPFTVVPFIQNLLLLNDLVEYQPVENDEPALYCGVKHYKKIVNDLVFGTKIEIDVTNPYYRESVDEPETPVDNDDTYLEMNQKRETDEPVTTLEQDFICKNSTNAVKYLLALISIISVESNLEQVQNDLKSYNSCNNIVPYTKDSKTSDTLNDMTTHIKLEKISWFEPNMIQKRKP